MYNFQIKTSFVNLNPLARNPGSAPASTIHFILFTWASPYGTIWNPVALPIWVPTWVPYRLLPSKHAYMGPIWATHMGSATGFGMGPIWVSPYAGCPDGSHITVP